ncbi:hypothetical protein KKB40_01540 [Patescibacteria group bacterium]|nr:hypothetical protein [Patescibacteria group bacterium]
MSFIKKLLRLIAEYFVFIGGFLFIFFIGIIYAFLRPEGMLINVIFLLIAVGWIIFLIKYFWDLMEKK